MNASPQTESWLEIRIERPDVLDWEKQILLSIVRPLATELRSSVDTYHFLFEPHLLLRLKAPRNVLIERVLPRVVQLVESHRVPLAPTFDQAKHMNLDYPGEVVQWSPVGWEGAKKYLECVSSLVLDILANEDSLLGFKPAESHDESARDQWARYLSHLLYNQFGNSWLEEAWLHMNEGRGRLHGTIVRAGNPLGDEPKQALRQLDQAISKTKPSFEERRLVNRGRLTPG